MPRLIFLCFSRAMQQLVHAKMYYPLVFRAQLGTAADFNMNLKMLKRDVGYRVRLVPPALYRDSMGYPTGVSDGEWAITAVEDEGVTITSAGGLSCRLGKDHVYSFVTDLAAPNGGQSSGFLQLHVQIIVCESDVSVVPNHQPGAPVHLPEIAAARARLTFVPEVQRIMRRLVYLLDRTMVNFSATGDMILGRNLPISRGDTWQLLQFTPPQPLASSLAYRDLAVADIELLAGLYGVTNEIVQLLQEWSNTVSIAEYNYWNVLMHKIEYALRCGDVVVEKFCPDCLYDPMMPISGPMRLRARKSLEQASQIRRAYIQRAELHFRNRTKAR